MFNVTRITDLSSMFVNNLQEGNNTAIIGLHKFKFVEPDV